MKTLTAHQARNRLLAGVANTIGYAEGPHINIIYHVVNGVINSSYAQGAAMTAPDNGLDFSGNEFIELEATNEEQES